MSRKSEQLNIKLNRLIKRERNNWPSPLARRMGSLLEEETGKQVLAIVAFLDSLSAFLGSILISIYINDPEKKFENENFNRGIFNFLTRPPTLGQWIGILRDGLKHFGKVQDFFISELLEFASGIEDPLKIEKNVVKIVKEKDTDCGLLDILNPFRLGVGHPEKLSEFLLKHNIIYDVSEDIIRGYEQSLPVIIPVLIRLLYGLNFLSRYWLFYIKNLRKEEGLNFADIRLYCSDIPTYDELNVTDSIKELLEGGEFEENIFRYKLFLGKIKKIDDPLSPSTKLERLIEVNPVLINWLREKRNEREYLPYRFLEWKKKKEKKIWMGEIVYQEGKEDIDHPDTRERLWDTYNELRNRLEGPQEKEEVLDEKEEKALTLSQSKQRYRVVRKEIYPHLNIADEILAGIEVESSRERSTTILEVPVSNSSKKDEKADKTFLRPIIENFWNNPDRWNSILLGEGGMGKTTSLLKLWESFLSGDEYSPVPLFLQLETYNQIKPEWRRSFIWYIIAREYHNRIPAEEEIKKIENQFMQKVKVNGTEYPSVILLLDGFNEVTVDTKELLLCLDEVRKMQGVQIIISSRYDIRRTLGWPEFAALTFEPLEDEQIEAFMSSRGIEFRRELTESIPLLRNPMMLTLYCGLEREMKLNAGNKDYNFILNPECKGEILHNFIESSLCRLDKQMVSEGDRAMDRLFIRHIAPRTGYEMERRGYFEIGHSDLRSIIKEEFERYKTDEFLDLYPEIDSQLKKIKDLIDETERTMVNNAIDKLRENYCILKGSQGGPYSFFHQDFRDYFAGVYIKNRIEECIKRNDNGFPELKERLLPYHIRSMVGEITGEARRRPVIKGGYKKGELKETLLDRALSLLRNEEMKDEDYRILNILEILKDKRVDLSDTDLSYLDLRHVVFNNVRLGYTDADGIFRGAKLKGSRIRAYKFFFHGHSDYVNSVTYSPDGSRIASGSRDRTIKEWDVRSGECLKTYKGHREEVFSISYSKDNMKITSGSRDRTVKEWDIETGECLQTYEGHIHWVYSVSYSSDGMKIYSGSRDGTIREWDIRSGRCIRIYKEEPHTSKVKNTEKASFKKIKYLEQLLKIGQTLNSSLELQKILNMAVELVVDFVKAERGFIMLFNQEEQLEVKAIKNLKEEEIQEMKNISRTILETVYLKGNKILSVNAQVDPRFKHNESAKIIGLRSVMCVPLKVKERIIGVIYLDNQIEEGRFNELHLNMLEAFSNQAAVAIENAKLHQNLIKSYEERIRLTLELHEQEKRRLASEEANRLKSEFVNVVANELRNPLTVIKTLNSMLYNDFISTDNRVKLERDLKLEVFEAMEHQIDRLVNMVKKQLDTSRIDAGETLKLELSDTDINKILDEVLRLQHTSNFYLPDLHTIVKELPHNLPPLICDREKITQVLYNLVENALKYSPEGGEVKIKIKVNQGFMHFIISDQGIGMSEEGQNKLFQKFQRIDTTGYAIQGTGLGLYLIKHLVELHKGTIKVTSKKGMGSKFSFIIPLN